MTLAEKLKDSKAVYAGAGAVDLAVEKLREVPEVAAKVRAELTENYSKYRESVTGNVDELRGDLNERVAKARTTVTVRVDELKANVARYQETTEATTFQGYVATFSTKVTEVIDELAERGKTVINKEAVKVEEATVAAPPRQATSIEAEAAKPAPKPKPAAAKKTPAKKA
ncbi:hypothetical protein EDD29_7978 [Actinocorallia herbida]|uniref:Heparin binding hemagglutinin HbhA n=1 Tax=Actinocorallia herbida TaxID=58109 RepID=A0A3N1D9T5_9ACTN|nr:hypothetical protein [Actinocorallia herbida]ROO90256.1 hypothetical protein EDD29_7978 [Actinocorallia herbida]